MAECDLSRAQTLGARADWVVSLEVGEHIPPSGEAAFLANIRAHARVGAVLSWSASPGKFHVTESARALTLTF